MILTYKPDFKSPRPFACDSAARILAAMAFLRSSGEASGILFTSWPGPLGLGGVATILNRDVESAESILGRACPVPCMRADGGKAVLAASKTLAIGLARAGRRRISRYI
jgi:hypothetical protein